MKLQLAKLKDNNKEAKALRIGGFPKDWEDVNGVLQYWGLLYVPELIHSKVISYYHNDLFVGNFGIDKTRELIGRKYY